MKISYLRSRCLARIANALSLLLLPVTLSIDITDNTYYAISPREVDANVDVSVLISGNNFFSGLDYECWFGMGTHVSASYESDSLLRCGTFAWDKASTLVQVVVKHGGSDLSFVGDAINQTIHFLGTLLLTSQFLNLVHRWLDECE